MSKRMENNKKLPALNRGSKNSEREEFDGSSKKLGFAGRLAQFFLTRKELGVLSVLALLAWGVLGFVLMPKQYNPAITAPAFRVITEFPGASVTEVYELVSRPMEDKIREIPEVDIIRSQSLDEVSSVTVQFTIGENVEAAKISLLEKLRSNMNIKPPGVVDPLIVAVDPDDVPIFVVALTSDVYSGASLRNIAHDVADDLKLVKHVSNVDIIGGEQFNLHVDLSVDRLEHFGVSVDDVVSAIQSVNAYGLVGSLRVSDTFQTVRVDGRIEDVHALKNITISFTDDVPVYLGDVADVSYSGGEITHSARFVGSDTISKEVAYIALSKHKGSNATTVARKVTDRLESLESTHVLDGVDARIVRNDGRVAAEETISLTKNLFTSVGIVALVLLVFLSWRSALIVFVSIPLTLAMVFGVGVLFDQTINRITLFALILSLGLLVDSAIVVVENIFRLLRLYPDRSKYPVHTIIAEAVDEVGVGLFMSTLTTILAFVPMAFVTGMMGPYMAPIPFFVPLALIASLLLALTLNPFLASVLVGSRATRALMSSSVPVQSVEKNQKPKKIDRALKALRFAYAGALRYFLEKKFQRRLLLAGVFGSMILVFLLPVFQVVPFRMLPKADKEQFSIYLDIDAKSFYEKTYAVTERAWKKIITDNEVVSVQAFIGEPSVVDFNGLFKGSGERNGEHQATLKVNLTHPNSRKVTSETIAGRVRIALNEEFADSPDVRVAIIEDPPGPPVLSTYQLKIQGESETISRVARELETETQSFDQVLDVDSTVLERGKELFYVVDSQKAVMSGVNSMQIISAMTTLLEGSRVDLYLGGGGFVKNDSLSEVEPDTKHAVRKPEQEFIIVRAGISDRDEERDILRYSIRSHAGELIALGEMITQVEPPEEVRVLLDQHRRTEYVNAEMGDRSVVYASLETLGHLVKKYKPFGDDTHVDSWNLLEVQYRNLTTGETLSVLIEGEWKLTLEVFRDLGLAMGVAMLLIYFVLVVQFGSVLVPLLIMATIPLALIGVLPGFALLNAIKGVYFNATSMIGVIALAGIVVNNAIILLEYLNGLKSKGYGLKDALIESGKTRLLPILLTSLTTILGSLTIISDPVWEGLAWAIIWGLSLSAFLTLGIFPLLYFETMKKPWKKDIAKKA